MPQQSRTVSDATRTSRTSVALALMMIVSVLVIGFGVASERADGAVHPEWGETAAKNRVLRKGCHNYKYTYKITPPHGDWGLETYLIGPGGKRLGSGVMAIGMDPKSGKDKFRICKATTRPGVFKIRAKLSVQEWTGKNYQEGWLPVTKFRLRKKR
ncbi:hypothetical protein [Nocardioides sp.]|uniref:hypothetical protein n=1 Tax=Nocardioides sp. TaxID=35761 RepID=UPI00356395AF